MGACRRFYTTTLLFAFSALFNIAYAEHVKVYSEFDKQGQGWLFGAAVGGKAECWIVVPRHVVQLDGSDETSAFEFTDRNAHSGYTDAPITASQIPGAIEALDGEDDLAFARVRVGRDHGKCLSRLGLPTFTYQGIVATAPELSFYSMLDTSFDLFSMVLDRVWADQRGGSVMRVKLKDKSNVGTQLVQGISGATGVVNYQNQLFPFVMLTNISAQATDTALGIRYDAIKNVFDLLSATDHKPINPEEVGYHMVSYRAEPAGSGPGPESLVEPHICWNAVIPAGQSALEFVLRADADLPGVKRVVVYHHADCSTQVHQFSVDQRVPGQSNWSRVRDCETQVGAENTSACSMDLSNPRELRITIPSSQPVPLSGILVR